MNKISLPMVSSQALLKTLALVVAANLAIAGGASAQNAQRRIENVRHLKDHIEVVTNEGVYKITPYSTEVMETSFVPNGQQQTNSSHAVVAQAQKLKTHFTQSGAAVEYATTGISVKIRKSPFQITYFYHGKLLTSEKLGYEKISEGERLSFNLDADEVLYGAGARALGMNRRGHRLPLYNKAHYGYEEKSEQMNFAIPLVYSSKVYGIHFDNAAIGTLDLDSKHDNTLSYETISGRKTYQVIAGANWENLVSNYVNLTGKQPLPPRWAFGNFASRFGYHSEAEARNVIAQFREQEIPVDAVIFDLYWFGKDIKGTMGNLAFDKDNFPNPQAMIADFAHQGVKTVLITEPFILTTSQRWQEAVDQKILATDKEGKPFTYDFYFGNTGLIDLFKPQARDWFWHIYKDLAQAGVAGVWGDLGEPEVHPSALQHTGASADQVHNIYGHEWAKLVQQGYQKDFPDQRPFILMRAGYSGSQRFGLIPWSGDVNRTWGGLRSQTEIALQMGMQGLAYMHSDLGGFAGANLDDELYARWLQYGVFQPIFRPHAQEEVPSEAIFRAPKAKALAKAAIELRYRMLPYNYTLAFENNQHGTPLMRPLFFAEANSKAKQIDAGTYLWGGEFLVHPVVNPGEKNVQISFPKTNDWFDFVTDAKISAGAQLTVAVHEDHIPVYVRAGAFIPLIQKDEQLQSTQFYSDKKMELHYYHDASVSRSAGKMYEDDGLTSQAYEKGIYRLLSFTSEFHTNAVSASLILRMQEQTGRQAKLASRTIDVVIHQVDAQPKTVNMNGKPVAFVWNADKHQLKATVVSEAKARNELGVTW